MDVSRNWCPWLHRCMTRRTPRRRSTSAWWRAIGDVPFELVIADDGSRDGTGAVLARLAAGDERVKVVTLARNFGHQAALTAALEHTSGDVVVMMDGDLQDPPEVIPEMLDRWRGGADVVYAVRSRREGETAFKRGRRAGSTACSAGWPTSTCRPTRATSG